MLRKRLLNIFLFGCVLGGLFLFSVRQGWTWNASDTRKFEDANELYRKGLYREAVAFYTELIDKHSSPGAIYYNLGNSFFRAEKMGEAILAYERALLYSPRSRDIRHNLKFVNGLLEYRVVDKRNWYLKTAEAVLNYFKTSEILLGLYVFYFLLIGGWAYVLFFASSSVWGWRRKTASIFLLAFIILFAGKYIQNSKIREAIVLERELKVHYGPSKSDQVAFQLGEGLKVYVVDKSENWSRILMANGESGWVANPSIGEVRP